MLSRLETFRRDSDNDRHVEFEEGGNLQRMVIEETAHLITLVTRT